MNSLEIIFERVRPIQRVMLKEFAVDAMKEAISKNIEVTTKVTNSGLELKFRGKGAAQLCAKMYSHFLTCAKGWKFAADSYRLVAKGVNGGSSV